MYWRAPAVAGGFAWLPRSRTRSQSGRFAAPCPGRPRGPSPPQRFARPLIRRLISSEDALLPSCRAAPAAAPRNRPRHLPRWHAPLDTVRAGRDDRRQTGPSPLHPPAPGGAGKGAGVTGPRTCLGVRPSNGVTDDTGRGRMSDVGPESRLTPPRRTGEAYLRLIAPEPGRLGSFGRSWPRSRRVQLQQVVHGQMRAHS